MLRRYNKKLYTLIAIGFLVILVIWSITRTSNTPVKVIKFDRRKTTIEKHPYLVSFISHFYGHLQCAGSLISEKWVITSADCASDYSTKYVRVGKGGILHKIMNTHESDGIVLIELQEPVRLRDVAPKTIKIANDEKLNEETTFIMSAWHEVKDEQPSLEQQEYPRQVELHYVSQKICASIYRGSLKDTLFCASFDDDNWINLCQEYIGAPVVLNGELYGIVTKQKGCHDGTTPNPAVLVKISHKSITSWITQMTGIVIM